MLLVCRCKPVETEDMQACISPVSSQADTLAFEGHVQPDDVSDVLDGSFGAQLIDCKRGLAGIMRVEPIS